MLSHRVLNHVQLTRHLLVVVVVTTQHHRSAVLVSTNVDLEPLRLYRDDKARFQIEFLFREAKQFPGRSDCPARSKAKRDVHCNASLSAVNLAKRAARQPRGKTDAPMSLASLKRQAFNQHLLDRIGEHLEAVVKPYQRSAEGLAKPCSW